MQGSCYWWARAHRSHHRYTDTDLDPYNSKRGLLWTHLGWMIFKSTLRSGSADVSDLRHDSLVCFQHQHYFALAIIFGYVLPATLPGLLWNDWAGGLCFAAALRLTIAHHVSTHAMHRGLSFPLLSASPFTSVTNFLFLHPPPPSFYFPSRF